MPEKVCTICGKPLTKEESIDRGMGDICAEDQAQGYMSQAVVAADGKLPGKGMMSAADAYKNVLEMGIPGYRFVTAIGGDKMRNPPITKDFQITIFDHPDVRARKWVSVKVLDEKNVFLLQNFRAFRKGLEEGLTYVKIKNLIDNELADAKISAAQVEVASPSPVIAEPKVLEELPVIEEAPVEEAPVNEDPVLSAIPAPIDPRSIKPADVGKN